MAPGRRRPGAPVTAPTPSAPTGDIPDRYDPAAVEQRWYPLWEERGYFRADPTAKGKPYSISMPPPNVTGSLHWGHALTMTLQDTLTRMKRMDGFNTLWLPGTDHAGIAVHVILERLLAAEGKTKEDLGRDGVPRARLAVEGRVRRHDRPPAPAPRRLVRLVARALHDGRRARARGAGVVRAALGRRADLPRRPHRQLVPEVPDRPLGHRGRARGARRRVRLHQVRPGHPGHGAAGDEARRHRPRRASQGQALQAPRGQDARGAVGGRHDHGEGRRGRGGRSQVRHRRHQGDAGPRSGRLRDRAPPQPARSRPSSASTGE